MYETLLNVQDVINNFSESVLLSRKGTAQYNEGFITYIETPTTIQAAILPLTFNELRFLPEGISADDWRTIWSLIELKFEDHITYNGDIFTIQKSQFWKEGGFYRAQMSIVRDTPI